jgi:DNA-binding XRE family transcriptional regulator
MKSDLTEHERARRWRQKRGFSQAKLASLTGFARETIFWMERGTTSPRPGAPAKSISPWVMQRYKNCCAGVEAELRSGKVFNWGEK